jgi:hypothetical protein
MNTYCLLFVATHNNKRFLLGNDYLPKALQVTSYRGLNKYGNTQVQLRAAAKAGAGVGYLGAWVVGLARRIPEQGQGAGVESPLIRNRGA